MAEGEGTSFENPTFEPDLWDDDYGDETTPFFPNGASTPAFKKNGVTVTAIFLAAGATIGAVIGAITNALKKLGKGLANGLKSIGAKAASALPGLIGAIASFLFKAAASVIGFLAEHTWLLILAVVAFLFQKLMNRRR